MHLGLALGNATHARLLSPAPPPAPPPIPLSNSSWSLWVQFPATANATWALDPAVRPSPGAPPSARVDVQGSAPDAGAIDLFQPPLTLQAGGGYALTFWARASMDGVPLHLNARELGGDWRGFGLDEDVTVGTTWRLYNISFTSTSDSGVPARLSWQLGTAPRGASVWINAPALAGVSLPLPVLLRKFDCGVAVVNGHTGAVVVDLSARALRRFVGQQAPAHQYIVDDASPAFSAPAAWALKSFDSGYSAANPSSEEVRPQNGFFHHWAAGARQAPGGSGAATFDLGVPAAGTYNVSMWFPAAVPDRAAWATAMIVKITPNGLIASVNLTREGGDMWLPLFGGAVPLAPGSTLTVECPAGGGACIADAVLVESEARLNDGSPALQVALNPMDAIVLQWAAGAPPQCANY